MYFEEKLTITYTNIHVDSVWHGIFCNNNYLKCKSFYLFISKVVIMHAHDFK